MKRVKLTHGSARVDENCSKETIEALDNMSKLAYEMVSEPLNIANVSLNEATSVVAVTGCPYRVQDNCNFIGNCFDENCNIRAKPVTEG